MADSQSDRMDKARDYLQEVIDVASEEISSPTQVELCRHLRDGADGLSTSMAAFEQLGRLNDAVSADNYAAVRSVAPELSWSVRVGNEVKTMSLPLRQLPLPTLAGLLPGLLSATWEAVQRDISQVGDIYRQLHTYFQEAVGETKPEEEQAEDQ